MPNCPSDWCVCDSPGPSPTPGPQPGPGPSPPAPTPAPSPPAPTPAPQPTGHIMGFWDGCEEGGWPSTLPGTGWFFSFPGERVRPPLTPSITSVIRPPPAFGNYSKLILTQGGGNDFWGDQNYKTLAQDLDKYKPAGWDGVCWDWEITGADHTSAGFNALMRATKEQGLINIVTTTAEGPYLWEAKSNNATDIDWSLVDFFVPQMYGASGRLPPQAEWEKYAQYWVDGAGKPTLHGETFARIPMEKFLWGMPAGTCDQAAKFGGSGCVEWASCWAPPKVIV